MATGRDFVLRHSSFSENWAACALSHVQPGVEAASLLFLATVYGTFTSTAHYLFFTVAGWLFAASLIFAAWLFK